MFEGIKVNHIVWGEGKILEVINDYVKLEFDGEIRNMQASSCLKYLNVEDSSFIEYANKRAKQQEKNKKVEEEIRKVEHELWLQRKSIKKKFPKYGNYDDDNPFLGRRARDIDMSEDEFFKVIGYLANPKNVKSFVAEIPSYYEQKKELQDRFPDSDFNDVGDDKQGCQFRIFLTDNENMPNVLKQRMAKNFGLSYSRFTYKLVNKYGFKFSDKQDIDKIKSKIPDKYLDRFVEGFNL